MFFYGGWMKALRYHHRDPFDRILISQAKIENLTIVTHDAIFKKYPIPLLKT
jgi:PIN domain nuclease of toxin-antitoxin system